MVDLSVNLCGMQMDNPVVPASGTFGFGKEFKDFYDINHINSNMDIVDEELDKLNKKTIENNSRC